jgi:hypothetical protein
MGMPQIDIERVEDLFGKMQIAAHDYNGTLIRSDLARTAARVALNEQRLAVISMRDGCFRDIIGLLDLSIKDKPHTGEELTFLKCLKAAIEETGTEGFGDPIPPELPLELERWEE